MTSRRLVDDVTPVDPFWACEKTSQFEIRETLPPLPPPGNLLEDTDVIAPSLPRSKAGRSNPISDLSVQ